MASGVRAGGTLDVPELERHLPPIPGPELDPFLDAAARCFSRYGIRRTTVPDIARELRVSRATVYRQGGAVDDLARQLVVRELHRLLLAIQLGVGDASTPETIVDTIEIVVTFGREHPVLAKVVADEPDLAWALVLRRVDELVDRVAPVVEPAVRSGRRDRDARLTTEWLIRLVTSLVLVPTSSDLRTFLDAVVRPVLAADGPR